MDDNRQAEERAGDQARPGAMVTIFRSRLDEAHLAAYEAFALETEARARASGGLLEFKTFTAIDGERCSIVVFADEQAHERWRTDDFHREAQRAGWERLYQCFEILVCRLVRRTVMDRLAAGQE